ncbi:hypothetical protein [Rhizobium sp. BK376]|uniref:hypothetical protein n=1 Tax=Rhizobium sp. BK376 TaxID=2512149 RepID=UPI001FDFE183|nr:hypothetical protein [Rhizobium sp. BK376]
MTLWLLKWLEIHVPRQQRASLSLVVGSEEAIPDLSDPLESAQWKTRFVSRKRQAETGRDIVSYEVRWRDGDWHTPPRALQGQVATRYPIEAFDVTAEPGH